MPRQQLTPNACLVCRRKRTKCDGQVPCQRCKSKGEKCSYEDKKWRTKDHLRSEIERLRGEQRQSQAVLRALVNSDPVKWDRTLDRMSRGEPPGDIAQWILAQSSIPAPARSRETGDAYVQNGTINTANPPVAANNTDASWFPVPGVPLPPGPCLEPGLLPLASAHGLPPSRRFSFDPPASIFLPAITYADAHLIDPLPPTPHYIPPLEAPIDPIPHTWTEVAADTGLVQGLFARFFASSLPYLSIISGPHFLRAFREKNQQYCSEALVNAILGAACRDSTAPFQAAASAGFGDAFVGEAKRLLALDRDHINIPSVQALGVLSIIEIAQGNEEAASQLAHESLRACIHLLLQTQQQHPPQTWRPGPDGDGDFKLLRALAYCGGFSLIRMLRLLSGDLEPRTGPLFMRMHPECEFAEDDTPEARLERGISLQVDFFAQLRHCPQPARFLFEVTEAAHTFSSYNQSRAMTTEDLGNAFSKCTECHRQVAESPVLNPDLGPDALFAQIWYNFCLLALLRPFATSLAGLDGSLPASLTGDTTPDVVSQRASAAIISLADAYQTHYPSAYLPPFLPGMILVAARHQLTLAGPTLDVNQSLQPLGRTTLENGFPDPAYDPSYTPMAGPSGDYIKSEGPSSSSGSGLVSPRTALTMQTPRLALRESQPRRPSALPTSPTAFSHGKSSRQPSSGDLPATVPTSATTHASTHAATSPESDCSPSTMTPQAHDLVARAMLQLTSMSAQSPAAATAAYSLHVACTTGMVLGQPQTSVESSIYQEGGAGNLGFNNTKV
ncbi:uncharacterized protein C8A04DRAFT_12936 [Dichotomopilus funicola]|uniref:Zn(2)-C6 fungal-type domain-containing protein n=1 Tax=Dichotomopilus funicola TaxID=1934379 RepID=A0AAN6V1Q2_9PEZI|nr:hypothetical protein C8A04DRAFT_12936 [Dichotomopilus funicola]